MNNNWKPEKNISSPWDVDVWENNIGQPVTDFIYPTGEGYEQVLFDLLYDWWDVIFDINPAPVDRNGEYLDKTYVIMDLVKAISEIKR